MEEQCWRHMKTREQRRAGAHKDLKLSYKQTKTLQKSSGFSCKYLTYSMLMPDYLLLWLAFNYWKTHQFGSL